MFFQELAAAYQRGYCYLCGDIDSLAYLGELQSGVMGNIFKTVLSQYVEGGAAMAAVQEVFVLTYQESIEDLSYLPDILQNKEKCRFIHIPTAIAENWQLNTKCCLLTENLEDGDFYLFIAKYHCKERNIPWRRICFRKENGGGDTTSRVLEKCLSQDKIPTLCLADSDRKHGRSEAYPNYPATGNTLKHIQKVSQRLLKQKDIPPHCLFEIPVHEIENLIPIQMIEELKKENMRAGIDRITSLRKVSNGEPLLYYDFKNGFPYIKEEPKRAYWKEILLALGGNEESMPCVTQEEFKRSSPKELFFPPIDKSVLRYVIDKCRTAEQDNKLFAEPLAIDEQIKNLWDGIGLQMLTWGYAREPLRV